MVWTFAAGRVNLIGEHIDYEGYGVLPMAIKQVSLNVHCIKPIVQSFSASRDDTDYVVTHCAG